MNFVCINPGPYTDELVKGQAYKVKKVWSDLLIELVEDKPRYYLKERFKQI